MIEQQKLIENLVEQQTLRTTRIMKQETEEEKFYRSSNLHQNALVAGPAPIRVQKMGATHDHKRRCG